jgi:hypothetical protein
MLDMSQIWSSPYKHELRRVYRQLGGILETEFPLMIGGWDIVDDNIRIELDEQLHFNRYRSITLESYVYKQLPQFPVTFYMDYCSKYEDECKHPGCSGKRWTTNGSVRQFGQAESPCDLSGNGSPRWKQRAFYDFVKDVYSLITNTRVARISIYDTVKVNGQWRDIAGILDHEIYEAATAIRKLIEARLVKK